MTKAERLHLRSRDPVAEFLIRQLVVPTICFEARWPGAGGHPVDVLAIDRAGSGDVHVVEIKPGVLDPKSAAHQLMTVPAQYRWLAGPKRAFALWPAKAPSFLYPHEGMGRIGVIEIVRTPDDSLVANIRFRAERFGGNLRKEVDAFLAAHRPDIEFR
jgi:hypothetical protein